MIYYAYELLAKFEAGLLLVGQEEEGELQWLGHRQQFQDASRLETEIPYRTKMPF